jgi:uncharacterized protein
MVLLEVVDSPPTPAALIKLPIPCLKIAGATSTLIEMVRRPYGYNQAMSFPTAANPPLNRMVLAGISGFAVGLLGGLIGLGGAEFRLPLLIGLFKFPALEAVIVNKATSLIVVASGLAARARSIPFEHVFAQWPTIVTLLAGSLAGAWFGADMATRLKSAKLYRIIAALLVFIALVLLTTHESNAPPVLAPGVARTAIGIAAGLAIGVIASLLGVAGGELLIPTLVLLFGLDIKLAGSVSLAISLPIMLVGFARYSRDQAFTVLRGNGSFVFAMGVGSILGALVGGKFVRVVPTMILLPLLAAILVVSAFKVWRHREASGG